MAEFATRVVAPGEQIAGAFIGIGCVRVQRLRELLIRIDPQKPRSAVRSICVIDKVSVVDHDAHAALKYAELPSSIGEARLGRLRSIIRADLARSFDAIVSVEIAYGSGE